MKRSAIELITILLISFTAASVFNTFSENGISPFKKYYPVTTNKHEMQSGDVSVETIDIEVFKFMKEKKDTVVLDARSVDKFRAGHIPGSYSFPIENFKIFYAERGAFLKAGKTIITYCSGINCTDSLTLAVKLKKMGVKDVLRFPGGIEEWIKSGNEVEKE